MLVVAALLAQRVSVEERKLDRTSACWCWLLLTASAACAAAAAAAVLQVGTAACTPSVQLVGCCKSAATAEALIFHT